MLRKTACAAATVPTSSGGSTRCPLGENVLVISDDFAGGKYGFEDQQQRHHCERRWSWAAPASSYNWSVPVEQVTYADGAVRDTTDPARWLTFKQIAVRQVAIGVRLQKRWRRTARMGRKPLWAVQESWNSSSICSIMLWMLLRGHLGRRMWRAVSPASGFWPVLY